MQDDTKLLEEDRAGCAACGSKIRATKALAFDGLPEPKEGIWSLADETGNGVRRVTEGFTGHNPSRGVTQLFQRRDGETKEHLETRIVGRLFNLCGEPYTTYSSQAQPTGYPDQLVLDAMGKAKFELELVGPGDQARSAEMNSIVDELRGEIESRGILKRLTSPNIIIECLYRQPSRHTRNLIVREILSVLEGTSNVGTAPATVRLPIPKTISQYVAVISLHRSSGQGGGLTVLDVLGNPLPQGDAIAHILEAMLAKTEKSYSRSNPGVPLELLIHSSGTSDFRWSPEDQFLDVLQAKVKQEKSFWLGSFSRVWLLSMNAYREVSS